MATSRVVRRLAGLAHDDSPARSTIEDNIRNQRPLVFLVVFSPRLVAGDAIPAGTLQVDVSPRLLIGLPR